MILAIPKTKRIVLFAGLLLAVIVAVNIFWGGRSFEQPINSYNEVPDEAATNSKQLTQQTEYDKEGAFFAEYRLQREHNRSREMGMLQELANNEEQTQSAREAASMKMMRIMEDIDKEMKAENLVKSRGIEECVVISEPTMSTVVIKGSDSVINEDEIKSIISPVLELGEGHITMVFRD